MSSSPATLKVLIFAASLRAESLNRKLADSPRASPNRRDGSRAVHRALDRRGDPNPLLDERLLRTR